MLSGGGGERGGDRQKHPERGIGAIWGHGGRDVSGGHCLGGGGWCKGPLGTPSLPTLPPNPLPIVPQSHPTLTPCDPPATPT